VVFGIRPPPRDSAGRIECRRGSCEFITARGGGNASRSASRPFASGCRAEFGGACRRNTKRGIRQALFGWSLRKGVTRPGLPLFRRGRTDPISIGKIPRAKRHRLSIDFVVIAEKLPRAPPLTFEFLRSSGPIERESPALKMTGGANRPGFSREPRRPSFCQKFPAGGTTTRSQSSKAEVSGRGKNMCPLSQPARWAWRALLNLLVIQRNAGSSTWIGRPPWGARCRRTSAFEHFTSPISSPTDASRRKNRGAGERHHQLVRHQRFSVIRHRHRLRSAVAVVRESDRRGGCVFHRRDSKFLRGACFCPRPRVRDDGSGKPPVPSSVC